MVKYIMEKNLAKKRECGRLGRVEFKELICCLTEKMSFKERPDKGEIKCHVDVLGKSILGSRHRGFRGSEAERCLACLRKSRKVCVSGKEGQRARIIQGLAGYCEGLGLWLWVRWEPLDGPERWRDMIWIKLPQNYSGSCVENRLKRCRAEVLGGFFCNGARGGSSGKWSNSGYVLMVEPSRFAEWVRGSMSIWEESENDGVSSCVRTTHIVTWPTGVVEREVIIEIFKTLQICMMWLW